MNSIHARGLISIAGPSGFVESRTATMPWPVPTSTQLPFDKLYLDFRQFMYVMSLSVADQSR